MNPFGLQGRVYGFLAAFFSVILTIAGCAKTDPVVSEVVVTETVDDVEPLVNRVLTQEEQDALEPD